MNITLSNYSRPFLEPGKQCLEWGVKTYLPLKKEDQKNLCQTVWEIAKRALYVIGIIALGVPSLLFALIGFFLQKIANLSSKEAFIYRASSQSKAPEKELPKELTISSFNVALLPPFITARNKIKTGKERLPYLKETIKNLNADILCLQEAFDAKLVDILAKDFPYTVTRVGPTSCKLNSGLGIFSRYPIQDISFTPHPKLGGMCRFSNKGMLTARIQIAENRWIRISTTHLNGGASGKEGGKPFRKSQTDQLKTKIEELREEDKDSDTIFEAFAGDFNTGPKKEDQENSEWNEPFSFYQGLNYYQEHYEDQVGPSSLGYGTAIKTEELTEDFFKNSNLSELPLKYETLDHIFFYPYPTQETYTQGTVKRVLSVASDHIPITSTFSLNQAT